MLIRTHLAVGLAVALYFLPYVDSKILFFPVVLISSLLPDINLQIILGRKVNNSKILKFLKRISSDNGISHTYTLCVAVSLVFALFYPVLALPFFLGYSFHLLLDSFTEEGITPFWPIKKTSSGKVKEGGKIEKTIFYVFLVFNLALLIQLLT